MRVRVTATKRVGRVLARGVYGEAAARDGAWLQRKWPCAGARGRSVRGYVLVRVAAARRQPGWGRGCLWAPTWNVGARELEPTRVSGTPKSSPKKAQATESRDNACAPVANQGHVLIANAGQNELVPP